MDWSEKATALYTIIRKEVVRILRIWPQTLIPSVINITLYFLIFGKVIGKRIQSPAEGTTYIEFIIPGLILMSVVTNSFGNVVSSFFSAKFQRNIDELLISPVPNWLIVVGYISGGVLRGVLVGVLVTLVSLFFADLQIHSVGVVVVVILLTAILFSLGGLFNAIFAKKFDDISVFPTFVLTPLNYLGGIFYSIAMLPDWAQTISMFNPIVYMVNAFRYGFLGISDIQVQFAIGILIVFSAGLFFGVIHLLNRGHGLKE